MREAPSDQAGCETLPPLTFSYAPRLTHDKVAHLSVSQKEQALHECLDLLATVKQHIYNPDASPQTRILALATIMERAAYTASGRDRAITDQTPIWIGDKEHKGSMVDRLGISRNAIGNELKAWERAGLATRSYRTSDNGNQHTDLSISPDLLTRPDLLPSKGERPRKAPVLCRGCGSQNLLKQTKTRIVCPDCGTVHAEHEHEAPLNQEDQEVDRDEPSEADSPPAGVPSPFSDEPMHSPFCTREVQKRTDPECTREVQKEEENDVNEKGVVTTDTLDSPPEEEAERLARCEAAAALLVEIAGPAPLHIEMNLPDKEGKPRKYGPVYRAFTLEDARAHLAGKKTKGARLWRPDGMTHALCYDADVQETWQALLDAARLLRIAGYTVVLEDSPVGRGGHLWIIYTGLVDVRCARRHVCELAPMLAEMKECWPAKNNVRLPGGRYVTPDLSAQCLLYDAIGARIAETGQEAAEVLLTYQTPAEIVPAYPPDPEPDQKTPHPTEEKPTPSPVSPPVEADDNPTVAQLIGWFNDTHSLESILPPQGDYANLPGQHHPSISYYSPDSTHAGEYWYDHGGTHQHGDAFELFCLVSGHSKREVLRDLRAEWLAHRRNSETQAAALSQAETRIEEDETRAGGLSASPEALAAEIGVELSEPCEQCGCPLRYQSGAYLMCHRCHPRPLRVGGLNDEQWRRLCTFFNPERARSAM